LASAQSQLEKQRARYGKDLHDLLGRQEESLAEYTAQHQSVLVSMEAKPCLDQQNATGLSYAVSEVKY
jgi:hypothetical protein